MKDCSTLDILILKMKKIWISIAMMKAKIEIPKMTVKINAKTRWKILLLSNLAEQG
jgi:hypothetical protein